MTHIPERTPKWKPHTNIGHVKNAIQGKMSYPRKTTCDMEAYVWEDDEWVLMWEIPKGTPYSELPWINTPEVKAKEEVERRRLELMRLESAFVRMRDAARLQKVWDASPKQELEPQLGFSPKDYLQK